MSSDKKKTIVGYYKPSDFEQVQHSETFEPVPACIACHKLTPETQLTCSKCNNIYYCSEECRSKDLSVHQTRCESLKKVPAPSYDLFQNFEKKNKKIKINKYLN